MICNATHDDLQLHVNHTNGLIRIGGDYYSCSLQNKLYTKCIMLSTKLHLLAKIFKSTVFRVQPVCLVGLTRASTGEV